MLVLISIVKYYVVLKGIDIRLGQYLSLAKRKSARSIITVLRISKKISFIYSNV